MTAAFKHAVTTRASILAAACLAFMLLTSHALPTAAQQAPSPISATQPTPDVAPTAPALSGQAAQTTESVAQEPARSNASSPTPPVEPVAPPGIDRNSLPHDLSPWGMFLAADIVVKIIMAGLAAASFVVWTVWLAKQLQLFFAKRRARRDLIAITNMTSLDSAGRTLARRRSIAAAMIAAAGQERAIASGAVTADGLAARIESRLDDLEARAGRSIRSGLSLLATVGATAPFIGLFGTVWGIMNSFIAISKSHTTNLAIVAPGIAEALLATAIGLVAAIPAVILYNQLGISVGGFRAIVRETSSEVLRIVSRDRDHAEVAAPFHLVHSAAE